MYQLGVVVRPDGADGDVADFDRDTRIPLAPLKRQEAKLLALLLAGPERFPERAVLAEAMGLERSTLQHHLLSLRRKGYVEIPRGARILRLTLAARATRCFYVDTD
jgi:DNA-binding MarR family transcriptional regulator